MRQYKAGQYVHIPFATQLFKLDAHGAPTDVHRAESPLALMYLGRHTDDQSRVFYLGEVWCVSTKNMYHLGEEIEKQR